MRHQRCLHVLTINLVLSAVLAASSFMKSSTPYPSPCSTWAGSGYLFKGHELYGVNVCVLYMDTQ